LQKYICVGRLTRDPEQRYTPNGKSVVNFGVAVNEGKDKVLFLDCEAWNGTAEKIVQYFKKGSLLMAEGRFRNDEWEDTEGNKRNKMRLTVTDFQFPYGIGGKPTENEADAEEAPKAQSNRQPAPKKPNSPKNQPKNQTQTNSDFVSSGAEDDDIPF
jgi:single-strand DNA-binding protein